MFDERREHKLKLDVCVNEPLSDWLRGVSEPRAVPTGSSDRVEREVNIIA